MTLKNRSKTTQWKERAGVFDHNSACTVKNLAHTQHTSVWRRHPYTTRVSRTYVYYNQNDTHSRKGACLPPLAPKQPPRPPL